MSKQIPQVVGFMTPFAYSVDFESPVREARDFMHRKHIRHLPVLRDGKLAGIITDRDIKLALGPDPGTPANSKFTVGDAYIADAYVVDASTPLETVATEMAERHIGSAIVTRQDKLVGVFTVTDACRALADVLKTQRPARGGDQAA